MKTKKIIDLAGMSFPESISFFGDKGTVEVDTKDFKTPPRYIKEKAYGLYRRVKKIPIIRGYMVLIDLFLNMIKMIFKNPLYIFLFIVLFSLFFLQPKEIIITKETKPGPLSGIIPDIFWDKYLFNVTLFGFVIIFIFLATKNHGAEHKAISAYEANQDLSLKNIKSQPKENERCGTVLVVWFWILVWPIILFIQKGGFNLFLQMTAFSFAYEIFRLARRDDTLGRIIYFPGWIGQKLTTREPNDKLLLRARQGLMRLLDEEGYRYQK